MACSIRNDLDGMLPPIYLRGSGSLCSLGGARLLLAAGPTFVFKFILRAKFKNRIRGLNTCRVGRSRAAHLRTVHLIS